MDDDHFFDALFKHHPGAFLDDIEDDEPRGRRYGDFIACKRCGAGHLQWSYNGEGKWALVHPAVWRGDGTCLKSQREHVCVKRDTENITSFIHGLG